MDKNAQLVAWISSVVASSIGIGIGVFFLGAFDTFSAQGKVVIFLVFSAAAAVALRSYFSAENLQNLEGRQGKD